MGLIVRNINFTGNFRGTFPQVPPPPPTPSDQYSAYTVLQLPGTGTNNATNNVFVDSSTNNFTITRYGNTTQGSFSPFSTGAGYWSNYFDGSGDTLTAPASDAFSFGTGNFTVECWVYLTAYPSSYAAIATNRTYGGSNSGTWWFNVGTGGGCWFGQAVGSGAQFVGAGVSIPLNTWTHLAVVRSSTGTNGVSFYTNGVLTGQSTINANFSTSSNILRIGEAGDGVSGWYSGYISNLRIVKGSAVYTTNFTPPTTPLTAVSGTSLLTCQSNRFIDNSSNNFAITRNGDTSVSALGPFVAASTYDASIVGGSMYFDGSGDYLRGPGSNEFNFGTGNFTVEGWVYFANTTGPFGIRLGNEGLDRPYFAVQTNGNLLFDLFNVASYNLGGSFPIGSWGHFAIVRNGATVTGYINGVATGSITQSGTVGRSDGLDIAYKSDGPLNFNGYAYNIRIVKGTAVYTSNFTPPSAPVTAVSGTSLLLNGTNAAIYDASTKNNIETVGDAKISTAISANGSMYFDGTGDYLTIPTSNLFILGSLNFTVEAWIYPLSSGINMFICTEHNYGVNASIYLFVNSSNRLEGRGYVNNVATIITSDVSVATNQWSHVVLSRNSNSLILALNGTIKTTSISGTIDNPSQPFNIGRQTNNSFFFNGYMNDFRVTKGIARYTSNFTPPSRS